MIPVSIISGFLGSGKTTLINDLVKINPKEKFAIVTNEFGNIELESKFLTSPDDQIIEFPSGCLCHAPKGDIAKAIKKLLTRQPNTTYILVEPSGLSDPFAVASALNDPELSGLIHLDAIICTLDCANYPNPNFKMEQLRQLDCADIILATKLDLARMPTLNTKAKILPKNPQNLKLILNTKTHNVVSKKTSLKNHSQHQSYTYNPTRSFNQLQLENLLANLPNSIVRAKGLVNLDTNSNQSFLLQYVGQRFSLNPTGYSIKTQIIFIGTLFDTRELDLNLEKCLWENSMSLGKKTLYQLQKKLGW